MSFERLTPDVSSLQTGDLVWPRADTQMVFFMPQHSPLLSTWFEQRETLMAQADPASSSTQVENFESSFWVGHVAFIELRDGMPWVVDATPHRKYKGHEDETKRGVNTQTYEEFLTDDAHTHSHIWHGRLKNLAPGQGQQLVQAASRHIPKPYAISPWSLHDTQGFYCSKLIWHAVRDVLGVELQGDAQRFSQNLWFTPWDVMQSPQVQLLFQPAGKSYTG
jgi:Permuted papain-like amidase enzyme, YaeF/YiiX, C92 family